MKDHGKKPILLASNIAAGYGRKTVLNGADVSLSPGEIVLLIGPNGSGKSTLLKVLAGLLTPTNGSVLLDGREVTHLPVEKRITSGISLFLQGGQVFPNLNIKENLEAAAANLGSTIDRRMERVYELFPILKLNVNKRAGLLSGGEKQMLALAMTLISQPKVLLLDEPSAGLASSLVSKVLETIQKIAKEETTGILLVEQNIREGISISDRVLLMSNGTTVSEDNPGELLNNGKLEHLFFDEYSKNRIFQ